MKINNQYPKLPVQDKNIGKNDEKDAEVKIHQNESKSSGVKRSSNQDFAVNRLKDRIESEPDINLEKVKELKDRIKNGDYKIDSAKLAQNLLKNSIIEDN